MATWLRLLTVVGLLLGKTGCQMPVTAVGCSIYFSYLTLLYFITGGTSAARSTAGAFGRSLLQQQSALCGSQGYIVGQSYCVSIRKSPSLLHSA